MKFILALFLLFILATEAKTWSCYGIEGMQKKSPEDCLQNHKKLSITPLKKEPYFLQEALSTVTHSDGNGEAGCWGCKKSAADMVHPLPKKAKLTKAVDTITGRKKTEIGSIIKRKKNMLNVVSNPNGPKRRELIARKKSDAADEAEEDKDNIARKKTTELDNDKDTVNSRKKLGASAGVTDGASLPYIRKKSSQKLLKKTLPIGSTKRRRLNLLQNIVVNGNTNAGDLETGLNNSNVEWESQTGTIVSEAEVNTAGDDTTTRRKRRRLTGGGVSGININQQLLQKEIGHLNSNMEWNTHVEEFLSEMDVYGQQK